MKIFLIFVFATLSIFLSHAQTRSFLKCKPNVILKSWYPEFKDFPTLKIGETKVLFTKIPDFSNKVIRDNRIVIKSNISDVKVVATEKTNQFRVTVAQTKEKFVDFEIWFDLEDDTVFLLQNGKWQNVQNCYPMIGNRILIDTVRLRLVL